MTLKEFMHTPHLELDAIAQQAEKQRATDEEAIYEIREETAK